VSKPSVRQNILLGSVQKLLDEGEDVHSAVIMSTRHRYFIPYSIAAGVLLGIVSTLTGVAGMNQLALIAAGAAVAGMATTNYSVLADTTAGLVLCRSSRVRQYAKELVRRLPAGTTLEMAGSTVITSDWNVDGVIYTMTKRWEATMRRLAKEYS